MATQYNNWDFFSQLYSSPRMDSWSIEGLDWCPIDESSVILLEKPFLEDEIKKAVFEMSRDKSPGPDGFSMAMFQECWEVIKKDLVEVFREFFENGVINSCTNASFICLIPKKDRSINIKDYRPISLVTSLYKIIAKVLSLRLREVLSETITEAQGAFVKGRQILDAVLIANELVEDYKKRKKEGVVFKLDFEKAYDHVDWNFLDYALERKGFGERWRGWIRGCLKSMNFAVSRLDRINTCKKGCFRRRRSFHDSTKPRL